MNRKGINKKLINLFRIIQQGIDDAFIDTPVQIGLVQILHNGVKQLAEDSRIHLFRNLIIFLKSNNVLKIIAQRTLNILIKGCRRHFLFRFQETV